MLVAEVFVIWISTWRDCDESSTSCRTVKTDYKKSICYNGTWRRWGRMLIGPVHCDKDIKMLFKLSYWSTQTLTASALLSPSSVRFEHFRTLSSSNFENDSRNLQLLLVTDRTDCHHHCPNPRLNLIIPFAQSTVKLDHSGSWIGHSKERK